MELLAVLLQRVTLPKLPKNSGGVSRKVSHTASFASVAKVAEKETRSYGERVSDFLGNLRSQGLFPSPTLMKSWRIYAGGKMILRNT